ncbi:MAG: hypothetical protein VB021_06295 [Oscillospiraceae bacterium]|nr:hypothetical protein [Oscillospiraceae bacterium]
MTAVIGSFAAALLLTAAVEGALMLLLFRRADYAYYSVLCNLLTNPLLNLLLCGAALAFGRGPAYVALLAGLECAVAGTEAMVYRRLCGWGAARALGVSAILNAASFFTGWALWPAALRA